MSDALQFLISGLVVGSIYGLIGVGFTCIYNVTGIVNFAQGDFAMVGAMSAIALNVAGVPLWLAIVLAIVITSVVAVLIERGEADLVSGGREVGEDRIDARPGSEIQPAIEWTRAPDAPDRRRRPRRRDRDDPIDGTCQ